MTSIYEAITTHPSFKALDIERRVHLLAKFSSLPQEVKLYGDDIKGDTTEFTKWFSMELNIIKQGR
jgi:hypothetical protein